MSDRITLVAARKGGVGKTSLTRELAARLARDHRVVIVDADPQATHALVFGLPEEPGLARVLTAGDPAEDWLRPVPRERWAGRGDVSGTLYLLPGDETTSSAGLKLLIDSAPISLLRDRLAALLEADVVDYVLVDTAPSHLPFDPYLFSAGDAVIIPTGGALEGVHGVIRTERGFAILARTVAPVSVLGIVPTQIMSRTNLHRKNWSALKRRWGDRVWPMLEYRITWQYAAQFGQALGVYAPGSDADLEMELVFEVFKRRVLEREEVAREAQL